MENNFDLSELLKKITENPEMLTRAMELASTLKESGALEGAIPTSAPIEGEVLPKKDEPPTSNGQGLGNILGLVQEPLVNSQQSAPQTAETDKAVEAGALLSGLFSGSGGEKGGGGHKEGKEGILRNKKEHQRLLHALRPYLSKERSEKAELIVNVLNMLELAEGMGIKLF